MSASWGERMKASRIGLVALVGLLFALAGCNTVAGVGEDLSAAGHAIKKAAD